MWRSGCRFAPPPQSALADAKANNEALFRGKSSDHCSLPSPPAVRLEFSQSRLGAVQDIVASCTAAGLISAAGITVTSVNGSTSCMANHKPECNKGGYIAK